MGMTVMGHIEITYKKEDDYVYQMIRIIPNASKNLHYFIRDRYKLGRSVDDLLMNKYIGDGQSVLFIEDNKFRNMNTIKYQVLDPDVKLNLTPQKYCVRGEIPAHDSCHFCKHMRAKKGTQVVECMLYKNFVKLKLHCIDFYEK